MLSYVKQQFPERSEDASRLYERDPVFRSLCHDYGVCMEELKRIRDCGGRGTSQADQYVELQSDLEIEILQYILEFAAAIREAGGN